MKWEYFIPGYAVYRTADTLKAARQKDILRSRRGISTTYEGIWGTLLSIADLGTIAGTCFFAQMDAKNLDHHILQYTAMFCLLGFKHTVSSIANFRNEMIHQSVDWEVKRYMEKNIKELPKIYTL